MAQHPTLSLHTARRWQRLLHDVPDSALDLALDGVPAEAFPGFEAWLSGRLQVWLQ